MTTALLLLVSGPAGIVYIVWELRQITVERKVWAAHRRKLAELYRQAVPAGGATSPDSSADRAPVS